LEEWLQKNEIDVAVTVLNRKPVAGIHCLKLLDIPVVLVVSRDSQIKDATQIWKSDRISYPLICLPPNEPVTQNFQAGLLKARVVWSTSIEVSSIDLIQTYVAEGYGIGVTVQVPGLKFPPGIVPLPLAGVEPLTIGLMWRQNTPLVDSFLEESRKTAEALANP
jgi:DNA-binding transcriptional LysR family regulator